MAVKSKTAVKNKSQSNIKHVVQKANKMMKQNAVVMKLVMMIVVFGASLILNVSLAQADDATLTIAPTDGDGNPKIVLVSTADTKRKVTATFTVSLSVPVANVEDGKKKVTGQSYTLNSSDGAFESESDITVGGSGFTVTLGEDGHSATISKSADPVDENGNPDPNGEIDWSQNGDGNFTVTANVYCDNPSAGDNDKTVTLSGSASYIGPDGGATVNSNPNGQVKFTAVKVTIESPSGDPLQSATARVNINEFTYNGASPGICDIFCLAKLEPDTTATTTWAEDNISWSTTASGGTSTTWISNRVPPVQSNQGKDVTLRLTGLPLNNDGFGLKTVTMSGGQDGSVTANFQVFFNRDATNHPGGNYTPAYSPGGTSSRAPNWFYYWVIQGMGTGGNTYFSSLTPGGAGAGVAPAMWYWANPLPAGISKSEIWLSNLAVGSYLRRDGSGQTASGIDMVANVIAHEQRHVAQIALADALLTQNTGIWAAGWAWNGGGATYFDNHYNIVMGNQVRLSPVNSDWPYAIPGTGKEHDAWRYETVANGTYQDVDLADNGKQHLTNGKWDD